MSELEALRKVSTRIGVLARDGMCKAQSKWLDHTKKIADEAIATATAPKPKRPLSEEFGELPSWAKKIVGDSDRATFAAYWYRRELVSLSSALHALCNTDWRGLQFEDRVIEAKRNIHAALDKLMDKTDKAEREAVRRQVVGDMKKYRETIAKSIEKTIKNQQKNQSDGFNPKEVCDDQA